MPDNLVSAPEAKAQLETHLPDATLDVIIKSIEAWLVKIIGPTYVDDSTANEVAVYDTEGGWLFLGIPIGSITSVVEYLTKVATTGTTLTENTDFIVDHDAGMLEKQSTNNACWGPKVVLNYVPQDRRTERAQLIIDILRLYLTRPAYHSFSISGEFSFTALSTDEEITRLASRMSLGGI